MPSSDRSNGREDTRWSLLQTQYSHFEDQLSTRMPALKETPFVKQDIYNRDITPLFEELT